MGVISDLKGKYDYRKEYSPDLRQIYLQYLKDNPFLKECPKQEGKASEISAHDMEEAVKRATKLMDEYKKIDNNYINANPNVKQFNQTIYESNLKTKFNEFVSQELSRIKCLNKFETTIGLLSIKAPDIVTQNGDFCEMSQNVSLKVKCDPSFKYRRIDGKCNHLRQTNWGAAFRCQRRLLPANFADGVNKIPVASDGSPLPNERFISNKILEKKNWCAPDQTLSSMQMIWGQLMAHDVIKTIQYMGFGLRCCPTTGAPHPECVLINDIPQDRLTMAFSNQTCMSFARSIACNACQLGPRNEESLPSAFLDLSPLKTGKSLTGTTILPEAVLPEDEDHFDLTACAVTHDRPWLKCLKNGDGIRGNQQSLISALVTACVIRHNQHCDGLAAANPHWDDDKLYHEARRLNEAEYNYINFGEYLPTLLNTEMMSYFSLNNRADGLYSEYNADLNPDVMQEFGAAAFRHSHANINSQFPILETSCLNISQMKLRYSFNKVTEIWDGKTNSLLKGMCEDSMRSTGLCYEPDVKDYFAFNAVKPRVIDLFVIDIGRARDHGIAPYLMVGGLAEEHMKGSTLGPTFACLVSIQFYHLKFGDRLYFEHQNQPSSFNRAQLMNIKSTASMANFLCKTTDFESIQLYPFLVPSAANPRIDCNQFNEFNYNLFRE
ncbi:unnamed protein product [Medioppia subpectinata]|uniref:Peroxidase n=1 Tax=Medioppia subpectinata TaxID=1979941 RepID=A0A7R9KTZ4_9ACAR|nr:unnamed protein product [Medioppia subpectinata]CAG2109697.1 unnamed protein product [Medioppia subpectinata]